eukprot:TRINITY_DN25380_c0_g1_i3.p1 TRINITY_DN25380_c0_g1~~TRINITY_DN25380_c0_g1_i3.p1  ORF type:complete len:344 (-),score=32.57 TRINITY_DN25380_c0_g1_i3:76-1107(-)
MHKHGLTNRGFVRKAVEGVRRDRSEWPRPLGIVTSETLPAQLDFTFLADGLEPLGYDVIRNSKKKVEDWNLQVFLVKLPRNISARSPTDVIITYPSTTFRLAWGPVVVRHGGFRLRPWPFHCDSAVLPCRPNKKVLHLSTIPAHDVTKHERFLPRSIATRYRDPVPSDMYKLLSSVSQLFPNSEILELGTASGAGAMALATEPTNKITTVDIDPTCQKRLLDQLGISAKEFRREIPNLTFIGGMDMLKEENWRSVNLPGVRVIHLDVAHFPYTIPFEVEFLELLDRIGWKGTVVADDIYFNEEMTRWWTSLDALDVPRYDVSSVGHWSGAGIIDFSGELEIQA